MEEVLQATVVVADQVQFISISLAFSIAAAVGFSPLSILAMAVILSSVLSNRIFVFTASLPDGDALYFDLELPDDYR